MFPESFEKTVHPNAVQAIRWLLQRNPEKRPTALALLDSPLLPARSETEMAYLEEAVRVRVPSPVPGEGVGCPALWGRGRLLLAAPLCCPR